ncbi:2'-5' RNA ligase family protein [Micromonospora sp. NBRC 101691]|uniref:2'-5' RNA ligase family protein n=1 Tax=Micromonospora sp. NBRC 101691 TaxID=3032198 RepID=UPI002556A432|nr:2'-5' RNA ligase family protein [Micromonospora sp. NBRC 101691]
MRRHLCVAPTGRTIDQIERWRRAWDPVLARIVPAHVTITYPEETADEDLLLRRAERLLGATPPLRLRLGEVVAEDGGRGGVFVAVHDVDGGWADLRRHLLAEPMTPLDVPAHLTVVHPRTSARGPECLTALAGQRLDAEIRVREVWHTETSADTFTILRRFPLATGSGRVKSLARRDRGVSASTPCSTTAPSTGPTGTSAPPPTPPPRTTPSTGSPPTPTS